ncbi:MAG: SapC family protein, partial [Proteobacteria bacterium]|nr:SapC family protein [Pseudomonadota bacterium]
MEDPPEGSGGNGADPAPDPAPESTGDPAGEATPGPTPEATSEALAAGAQGAQAALPLFYKDPQPLHTARHAGKGLKKPVDYRFAAAAHAVVLHAQEFRLAAAHYPIVFAAEASSMPLAVLGFRDRANLFVAASG